jgi:hypothetical protein
MAAAHQRGAGWVLARPLRPPRTGNQHTTLDKPTATKPSSPSMIFRRLPASSSFVLAAARLRALQLDPWPRGGKDQQLRGRIQKNSQPSPAARSHRVRSVRPLDTGGPYGCRIEDVALTRINS